MCAKSKLRVQDWGGSIFSMGKAFLWPYAGYLPAHEPGSLFLADFMCPNRRIIKIF